MVCGTGSGAENIEDKQFQDLSRWEDKEKSLADLRDRLGKYSSQEVRVYTVETTRLDKDLMVVRHEGSGPNLEGDLATLCTCKHSMRQYHDTDEWEDKWILGLTSRAKDHGFCGEHYLFYLMKVAKAFPSHRELYNYLEANNPKALLIKKAVKNRLGDIFEPKSNCTSPLDPMMYVPPCENHSHKDSQWYYDIVYNEKPAPLLIGDKDKTFVWTKPTIKFTRPRNTSSMKLTIGEILFGFLENA